MDFTLTTYQELLSTLKDSGYSFQTFEQFITNPLEKVVIMRHDVDRLPGNALKMARIEHGMGITASYYFRAVPVSFDPGVMEEIAGMGHEVGYHYENIDSVIREGKRRRKSFVRPSETPWQGTRFHGAGESTRICANEEKVNISAVHPGETPQRGPRFHWAGHSGNGFSAKGEKDKKSEDLERLIDLGYEDFCRNLEKFREIVDVKTVCMHGSPMSRYDNRMIWEKYDYRELGIIGEPYFDVDYKEVFYVTDTGRRWNHESASVRDRVESGFDIEVRSTGHLIEMLERREKRLVRPSEPPAGTPRELVHRAGESALIGANEERINISLADRQGNNFNACGGSEGLPDKIMFNVHPQRWHDRPWPWVKAPVKFAKAGTVVHFTG